MKKVIEFIAFSNRVNRTMERVPSIRLYKKHLENEWSYISEASLSGTPSKVKRILPLKSLKITDVIGSTVYVKFDRSEFNKVMKSKINKIVSEFIDEYRDQKIRNKYDFYIDNRETLELLLDAINEDYHLDSENDTAQLVAYLRNELKHSQTQGKQDKDVKQRMEIELEFIKRRKEAQKYEF